MNNITDTLLRLLDELTGLNKDMIDALYLVITTAEAARMWSVDQRTVQRWLDDPRVVSRASNNGFLISYISLVVVFGRPVVPLREVLDLDDPRLANSSAK